MISRPVKQTVMSATRAGTPVRKTAPAGGALGTAVTEPPVVVTTPVAPPRYPHLFDQQRLLIQAIHARQLTTVKECVRQGADINAPDASGQRPLHHAIKAGNMVALKWLLQQGADCDAPDCEGDRPLHYAVDNKKIKMVDVLLEKGAPINAYGHKGNTALHCAVETMDEAMVKHLLARGADIYLFNDGGHTPYDCTSRSNKAGIHNAFRPYVTSPPASVRFMHALKTLGVFFAHGSSLPFKDRQIRFAGAYSPLVRDSFLDSLRRFQVLNDNPAFKKTLSTIFTNFEAMQSHTPFGSAVHSGAFKNDLIQAMKARKLLVFDLSWKGHAVYGTILRDHKKLGHKNVLVVTHRGGGRTKLNHGVIHTQPLRVNGGFALDLGDLTESFEYENLANWLMAIKAARSDKVDQLLYHKMPGYYKKIDLKTEPVLAMVQQAQTTGSCVGTSIKTACRLLLQLNKGQKTGETLYKQLSSFLKADLYVDALKQAEDYLNADATAPPTLLDDIQDAFHDKWEHRLLEKEDTVAMTTLRQALERIRDRQEYPRTRAILERLINEQTMLLLV